MSRGGLGVGEGVEDVFGDVSFETADDFGFGEPFLKSSLHVLAGGLVVAESDDDDPVEGGVGLAVSAPVESMSLVAAGGGVDR